MAAFLAEIRRRWQSFGRRALVAVVAVLAALLPLGYFFGGTVIRIVTNKGELVVEPDDPTVEVVVKMNGEVVQVRTTNREFTLTAGDGQVEVYEKDGIKLATKKFTLTRGGKETVRVTAQELADVRKLKLPGPQRALVFRGGLRGSAQPENLVTYQGVQQELHMTPQQILRANAVVRQMSNKHAGLFLTLRGYRDERASVDKGIAVHKTAAEETLKALAGVLEPEQVKRLKQIHLQEMAVFAFLDLEIQNALKVSDEQKDKIRTLAADTVANERDAYDHARGGNPERQVKADMIRKDSREKAEAILNDGQKKTWKEMIGEAVEIQVGREQVLLRRRRAGPVDDTWDPIEMGKGLAPAVEAGSRPPLPKR